MSGIQKTAIRLIPDGSVPSVRLKTNKRTTRRIGKNVAASSPAFRLPPAISERLPAIAGLTVLPKSPANAKTATWRCLLADIFEKKG